LRRAPERTLHGFVEIDMSRMPTVFLSHGSPMHAIEPGDAGPAWYALARQLPQPEAILIASAHWEADMPELTSSRAPETIYDFYGFPEELYAIRYPAPGAPELAARAQHLLNAAGYPATLNPRRGLDHGAWVPLRYTYPNADIPVTQISIQTKHGTRHHYGIGEALAPLMSDGILIIGSGHATHNLGDFQAHRTDSSSQEEPYAREFQRWLYRQLTAQDDASILDYVRLAPHAARAHPTPEHFLPLLIPLGAAGRTRRTRRVFDGMANGVLAMDAYVFEAI